jgi:hypothetical protein
MNQRSSANLDHSGNLECPKCGAPAALPNDLSALMLHCEFCREDFPIPRTFREARERQLHHLRPPTESTSKNGVLATIFVFIVGAGVAALLVARRNPTVPSPHADDSRPAASVSVAPTPPPPSEPEQFVACGEAMVREQLAHYASAGCDTLLLEPVHIVGERDIDAKLVAGGACVRIVAATGPVGEPLRLTMRTPRGRVVPTPSPATAIDFLYCPTAAGAHPATITGVNTDCFTVASVECPRPARKK